MPTFLIIKKDESTDRPLLRQQPKVTKNYRNKKIEKNERKNKKGEKSYKRDKTKFIS